MSYSNINSRYEESSIIDYSSEPINTDIGYSQDEIIATSTEDLIMLRKAIYSYLKSPNLKKRNPNYLKVFKRINEELKKRKFKPEDKNHSKNIKSLNGNELKKSGNFQFDNKNKELLFNNSFEDEKRKNIISNNELLKRKRINSDSEINLDIPSFLQDKSTKEREFVNHDDDLKFNLKSKNCKSFGNSFEFGNGTEFINTKTNFASTRIKQLLLDDNDEFNFFSNEPFDIVDKELKDIQISLAIANDIIEDSNFVLI